MRLFIIICALMVFIAACDGKPSSLQGKSEVLPVPKVTVEKEQAEKGDPLPPEVKIKLKRDGKDSYSWELSGSDADQILKVNEKLRKKLGGEQQK
ncbi:MAG: hypothetical protein A2V86_16955 [Deltaproteobacteria bacterium RBG_16_49_23]|nr:MAG: hypothetical protein A2V86_16955 [Deltaproteobacteria bacterium RBG_16_49_23]